MVSSTIQEPQLGSNSTQCPRVLFNMHIKGITPSPAFVTLLLALRALSATVYQELHVVNANLAPDGFNRS